jgi:hypothetical protein
MIDENDVREMLHRRATTVPTPVVDASKATRRARRRLFANGVVASLAAVTIALAGLAVDDEIRSASVPADQTTPSLTAPTPSPIPSTSPFQETFVSPLNGLTIRYPTGWQTRPATQAWGHGEIAFSAPDVDVIFDPKFQNSLYLAVASEPLGSKSPKDWVYDIVTHFSSVGICQIGGGGGAGDTFQGDFAWFEECLEPHGARGDAVVFATATRGYIIYNHVATKVLQATYDTHWFEDGVLATVEMAPSLARSADSGIGPRSSPDSSQLGYQAMGARGVVIADADGSNVRTLDHGDVRPWHPGTPA